jgi:outer membrane receptor protein involved in Fe transport
MGGTTGVEGSPYGTPTVTEAALYLQDEIDLGPQLSVSAGGRLDLHATSDTDLQAVVSPKAALVVRPSELSTLRLTVGRGFRAPSVAETFISMSTGGFTVVPNPDLEPESVWGGEIGGSYSPLPLLRIEGSIFRNRYSSMIEGVTTAQGEIQFRNVRSARLQGCELTVQAAEPGGRLRGQFTYLWLSARDLDSGRPLAYRRPRRGSGTVEMRAGEWRLAADLLYGAPVSRYAVYAFDRRISSWRLDARVSRTLLGLRVTLHGRNLTNYAATDIERNLTAPREFLLSIEWSK